MKNLSARDGFLGLCWILGSIGPLPFAPAYAREELRTLPTMHMPVTVSTGVAPLVAALPPTQQMTLTAELPLRDEDGLKTLISELYDPKSAVYRHFLSVAEFTWRFGPTESDRDAAADFFAANGLAVTGTTANNHIVKLAGAVGDVERVLHVKLGIYRRPGEPTTFFAPDREPSVSLNVPLLHIAGLDNFALPHSSLITADPSKTAPVATGSGPNGAFFPSDMRAAYYGNGPLTGAGQSVALVELGTYWPGDLTAYFGTPGLANNVPITNILLDGAKLCTAACADAEEILDIVQPVSIAPGLANIFVYMGVLDVDVCDQIASDNTAKQVSSSFILEYSESPALDPIFQEMAAQGQTLLHGSADCGAYDPGANASCPKGIGMGQSLIQLKTRWSLRSAGPCLLRRVLAAPGWAKLPGRTAAAVSVSTSRCRVGRTSWQTL